MPGKGRALTLQDLHRDPEGQRVAAGLLRYLDVLAVLKRVRDQSRLDKRTPLISAGMAELTDAAWLRRSQVDGISIPATYAFLRAHGLDGLVDGYGVHFYPRVIAPGDTAAVARQRAVMDTTVFAPGNAKPYWLTEWGISSRAMNSAGDQERARAVSGMRRYFAPLFRQGRLAGIFWYVWNAPDPRSVYRQGTLLEAGREAIAAGQ